MNKFLTAIYFRMSSRRTVVTIIRLTISGIHSHLHIYCLFLFVKVGYNLTLTCALSIKFSRISVTQLFCTYPFNDIIATQSFSEIPSFPSHLEVGNPPSPPSTTEDKLTCQAHSKPISSPITSASGSSYVNNTCKLNCNQFAAHSLFSFLF